jgi:hypothetical protein
VRQICNNCWAGKHSKNGDSRANLANTMKGCRGTRCDCPCIYGGFKVARVPMDWQDDLGVVSATGLKPTDKDARLDQ